MRFMVAVFLASCFLSGCRHAASPQADELDAFMAARFDDVTVYAIDSSRPIHPASMEVGDYAQWISQVDSIHFHRFPIRKQVVVTAQTEGRKLASAGMRQWAAGANALSRIMASACERGTPASTSSSATVAITWRYGAPRTVGRS